MKIGNWESRNWKIETRKSKAESPDFRYSNFEFRKGVTVNINGHGLRDHLRLVAPLLGLIAAVWALRLILAAAGAPLGVVKAFSVTIAGAFCVLVAVLLIHVRRFGGYPNVVFVSLLLSAWQQLLIVIAISVSGLAGKTNIYSAPEFSGHAISLAQHITLQLTVALGFGTLIGAATGCLLLWMLRRLPVDPGKAETSRR